MIMTSPNDAIIISYMLILYTCMTHGRLYSLVLYCMSRHISLYFIALSSTLKSHMDDSTLFYLDDIEYEYRLVIIVAGDFYQRIKYDVFAIRQLYGQCFYST